MSSTNHSTHPVGEFDDVLITAELARRPFRAPDCAAESRALGMLAQEMATNPAGVLQKCAELALELCQAESAGVSILELGGENGLFRWQAAAGAVAAHLHGTAPRPASPCGMVIAHDSVLLFKEAERVFPSTRDLKPRIHESLITPWHVNGEAAGTLWAMKHTPDGHFDAEDARLLQSLAWFAAAAHQTTGAVKSARTDETARRETLEADPAGMRRLHELHARLATETDLKVALDGILTAACAFTATDRG